MKKKQAESHASGADSIRPQLENRYTEQKRKTWNFVIIAVAVFFIGIIFVVTRFKIDDSTKKLHETNLQINKDNKKSVKESFEYKAHHILLKTENEAIAIIDKLNKGADFFDLAKLYSTDPNGPGGGDIGWFKADETVKSFWDAVAGLRNGKYTEAPVKSKYGWHVILREDARSSVTAEQTEMKPGKVFQDTLKDGSRGPEMVVIPSGSFIMGAPESEAGSYNVERPQYPVKIAKPLAIGKYEVTVGQFKKFVLATAYKTEAETSYGCYTYDGIWKTDKNHNWNNPGFQQDDQHPVVCVSWYDVKAYIKWLIEQTGKPYRLPSEAEWEYAARAGSKTSRYWNDNSGETCVYANVADKTAKQQFDWSIIYECTDGYVYTAPVGKFIRNPFKLKDMLGNAWEWVEDCRHGYDNTSQNGSVWQGGDCSMRVLRGGSWGSRPWHVRLAKRFWSKPHGRGSSAGFRLAQDL